MGLLTDRVAVVTGAGRGIGRAIALALAGEGAQLVLAGRSVDALEQTRKLTADTERDPLVVPTDITVPDQVEALARATLEALGGVDVLVNNSGIGGPSAPLWEVDPADWEATMAVNVTGTYLCCRAFLPAMVTRRSGSVVIIGSMTGKRPLVGRTPYAASKMALVNRARASSTVTPSASACRSITQSIRSPSTGPGEITFTRTPYDPVSAARVRARPTSAILLAA